MCCFLATSCRHSLPIPPCSPPPPPWRASWGSCELCCFSAFRVQLWRCIVVEGFAGLRLALQHLHPSNMHHPHLGLIFTVNPLPEGTCCHLLIKICRGGSALDMGLIKVLLRSAGVALPWTLGRMPSVPVFIHGSSPSMVSAIIIHTSQGPRGESFELHYWHALYHWHSTSKYCKRLKQKPIPSYRCATAKQGQLS